MKNMEKIIKKCLSSQCGFCRENCPAYIAFQLDSYSSRGKNLAINAYLNKEFEIKDLNELAIACTQCKYCKEVCLVDEGAYSYIKELRNKLIEEGYHQEKTKKLVENIIKNSTPYEKKDKSWSEGFENKGTIGYFPGCTIQAHEPSLAKKTMKLLKKIGINAIPITNPCCGAPVIRTGYKDDAEKLIKKFCKEIKEKKIKKIISSCPGCVSALKNEYPKFTKDINFKVYHISETLNKNLKNLKSGKKGVKVIYHDPCHLARELGIIKEPRKILEKLGCQILEFDNSGKYSLCCGGGANFALNFPEKSINIAVLKIDEALQSGADFIVTSCPLCKRVLSNASEGKIEVLDIMDLIENI